MMAKYVDDQRVIEATDGVTAASVDMDEAEDQIKASFKALYKSLFPFGAIGSGHDWAFYDVAGSCYWRSSAGSQILSMPLLLRVGQTVTQLEVEVSGAGGSTAGTIVLAHGTRGTALTKQDLTGGAGHPWDTGGTGYVNKVKYTYTPGAPIVIEDNKLYFVEFASETAGAKINQIWDVRVKTKFGN